jgi:phosphatidylglycerol---prolipoprotein diacylglyceryl transferase
VQPELDLGPLALQTFGLALAAALGCSGVLAHRRLVELGRPPDWAYEALFAAALGGIVGAHLDWVVENWDATSRDLLGSLFSGTGLVFFGGLAGGALAVLAWARWRRYPLLELLDLAAPCLAVGYAVGRVACQLAGDGDYGVASGLPWAMAYPNGTVPTSVPSHPTPIYETVAMGLVTYALWRARGRLAPGMLFAAWLVLAGGERFLIEFIRLNDDLAVGLSLPQFIALAMASAGGVALLRELRRKRVRART